MFVESVAIIYVLLQIPIVSLLNNESGRDLFNSKRIESELVGVQRKILVFGA